MSTPQQQRRSKADRTYSAFSLRYVIDHPNCEAAESPSPASWG
jgi:hypothetical protein